MINALAPFLIALALVQSSGQPRPAESEATPAPAGALVVAELFTSQACRFCPAANDWLALAGEREHVLALAYGVDYWDAMYNWPDEYARPEFVERQKAYVDAGEARRVFTPHLVINGGPERMRFSPERAEEALAAASFLAVPEARVENNVITIRLDGPRLDAPADVWVMHYTPGAETRLIGSGGNAGLEMTHYNMVRAIAHAGHWPGGSATLSTPAPQSGQSSAVLVQTGPGGRLIGAVRVQAGASGSRD
ncbi:DUF1223 domain-containing protein [Hyphomonadaceae bacterium BL14]|nr:DUF1223 domain-containing protein [Hyphomonadaceae bacterium BL14]